MPRYELRLRVDIREVDPAGHYMGGASQLNVGEEIQFEAADFLEMAAQLGEFHHVAERIKNPPQAAGAYAGEVLPWPVVRLESVSVIDTLRECPECAAVVYGQGGQDGHRHWHAAAGR